MSIEPEVYATGQLESMDSQIVAIELSGVQIMTN